jgi:TolC family type I secretion outer membrane protein
MKKLTLLLLSLGLAGAVSAADSSAPEWLSRPLSLADSVNIALAQNAEILKAKDELQAAQGVVIQTRAVALPTVQATGKYTDEQSSLLPQYPASVSSFVPTQPHQSWNSGIQIIQNIYAGGRMVAAFQGATATRKQAMAQYQTALADALLLVRLAYYDVLLAEQQIVVNEASVKLLGKELDDQKRRFDAGTVPHFFVLRAEVALANAKPNLIHARSQYRIAKNVLVNQLGYNLPREVLEDIPMNLTDGFDVAAWNLVLPDAIQQALERRPELKALRQDVKLQEVNVVNAKAGYKPTLAAFAGYNWLNNSGSTDLSDDLSGWVVGGQLTWNLFDGALTIGKVKQARALYSKSKTELQDRSRQVELNVRTAYSDFIEAREVLDSQSKVQEQAEEALREATARFDAGTGTQLDVLDAETSLTQARTTLVTAQHDYAAARARLERAIGAELATVK